MNFLFFQRRQLSMRQWVVLSSAFSCALLLSRIWITGRETYFFMSWNLFLAWIPYIISILLSNRPAWMENKWICAAVMLIWVVFLPNAFYIVTDLFHLDEISSAPKWFDLLLLFSFAWNGLLLGILSMRRMELIIELVTERKLSTLVLFSFMWLNAFGIYIGRYLRFNSWDVVMQPFTLVIDMMDILLHPYQSRLEWGMITVYAVFLTLLYGTLKKAGEGMTLRGQKG